ncbi:MAG TPA: methyltransferase domain-containing protein [Polyangiaceae bacterium]|nr:methyltransferase domain-containing protein [Polyangiaceae bacterium]
MAKTPAWLEKRIRDYYLETTEPSYLAHWSGDSLALHLGLGDEKTATLNDSLLNTNHYLADQLRISEGSRVLDAGCGVGGSAIWLAENRGAQVTGISIAPNQVELAERFAKERGVSDRVSFACMDFMATTFDEASFDVVWNMESLCHAADPLVYFHHVAHLLADGGHFGCTDLFLVDPDDEHAKAICEGWILPSLRSIDAIASLLGDAGFTSVRTEDLTARVLRSATALRAKATNKKLELRAEKVLLGVEAPLYEGHVDAGARTALALESGSMTYGFAGGVRSRRV